MSDRLTLETPERVAVELDLAGVGHRAIAWLVDALIQFLAWMALLLVSTSFLTRPAWEEFQALAGVAQALVTVSVFAINWGYHVAFEIAWAGRSPGKRLAGIRVVKPDGSPEGPLEAVLRNLARAVDVLPVAYVVGLTTMALTPTQRRLGDLVAGTVLVKERAFDLSRYDRPKTAAPAATAGPTLTAATYELVRGFLSRRDGLEPEARRRVAAQLVAAAAPEAQREAALADPEAWLAAAAAAYEAR